MSIIGPITHACVNTFSNVNEYSWDPTEGAPTANPPNAHLTYDERHRLKEALESTTNDPAQYSSIEPHYPKGG